MDKRKEVTFRVVDVNPPYDTIDNYKKYSHILVEARRDNIQFEMRVFNGQRYFRAGKYWYESEEAARHAIRALQEQIAPSEEVRS